jgi:hypothetical protein
MTSEPHNTTVAVGHAVTCAEESGEVLIHYYGDIARWLRAFRSETCLRQYAAALVLEPSEVPVILGPVKDLQLINGRGARFEASRSCRYSPAIALPANTALTNTAANRFKASHATT